jgi:hypothetical protein
LAAAAAIIAQAVFDVISIVGVARTIFVLDVGIIFRALIDILYDKRDRRPGRHLRAACRVGEHAGQDFDRIGLLALRGVARLAGTAAVEVGLDIALFERNARRTAVDDAANRRPVTFTEGRDPE